MELMQFLGLGQWKAYEQECAGRWGQSRCPAYASFRLLQVWDGRTTGTVNERTRPLVGISASAT